MGKSLSHFIRRSPPNSAVNTVGGLFFGSDGQYLPDIWPCWEDSTGCSVSKRNTSRPQVLKQVPQPVHLETSIELITAFLLVCIGSQRTCCHREPATCRKICAYRHNKDTKGFMLSSKRCRWQHDVKIVSMSAETAVSMNGKRLWSPCLSVRALYRYVPQLWKMAMASSKNSVKGWGTWTVPEDCGRVSRASHTSLSLL